MIDLSKINEKVNNTILNCKEDGYHRHKTEKDKVANEYREKIIKTKDELQESINTFLSLNVNDTEVISNAKHLKIAMNTDKTEIASIKNLENFDRFCNKSEILLKEINKNIEEFDNLTIKYLLNLILTLYKNKIISDEDVNDLVCYEKQYKDGDMYKIGIETKELESGTKISFLQTRRIKGYTERFGINLYGLRYKKTIIENLKIFIEKMCN